MVRTNGPSTLRYCKGGVRQKWSFIISEYRWLSIGFTNLTKWRRES